jgi:probable addiction module antidote protein
MNFSTEPFDAAPIFDTPEAQAELLAEAFETGEVGFILSALHTVARARGLSAVADEIGISRQGLRKALGEGGNPTLATLLGVVKSLGFQVTVTPSGSAEAKT